MYKILPSIITERTDNFLDNTNIIPTEKDVKENHMAAKISC